MSISGLSIKLKEIVISNWRNKIIITIVEIKLSNRKEIYWLLNQVPCASQNYFDQLITSTNSFIFNELCKEDFIPDRQNLECWLIMFCDYCDARANFEILIDKVW